MSKLLFDRHLYEEICEDIKSLGFRFQGIKEVANNSFESSILYGINRVARIVFDGTDTSLSLRILPADKTSYSIMAGGGYIDNLVQLNAARSEIEILFRTYMVSKGRLSIYEMLPDSRLLDFLGQIKESIGSHGNPRFRASSDISLEILKQASNLLENYDREQAIKFVFYLSTLINAAKASDESSAYVSRLSSTLVEYSYNRAKVAWEHGSSGLYLTGIKPAQSDLPDSEEIATKFIFG